MPRPSRPRSVPNPIVHSALLATLVVGQGCEERAPLAVETHGSAEIVAVGDAAFTLEAEIELALSSGIAESVALGSVCFQLTSRNPNQMTGVTFGLVEVADVRDEWPVVLSGDPGEVVTRRLRVKAVGENRNEWSHPCQLDEHALSVMVELIPSESDRLRGTCGGGQPLEHRLICPSCPASLEALGFEETWNEDGREYSQGRPTELVGDVDGAVWSIVHDEQGLRRLARAAPDVDGWPGWHYESEGIWGIEWHALSAGTESGVHYAEVPVEPEFPGPVDSVELPVGALTAMRVSSRSTDSTRWHTELVTVTEDGQVPTPVVAPAAGRVFVGVRSPVGLYVDGELVDEGSPSEHYAALFDEQSGELLDHVWLDRPLAAARGLPDGGFVAIAAEPSMPYAIVRFEADASVSWVRVFPEEIASDGSNSPAPFAVDAEGGSYWYAPSGVIHRVDVQGNLAWSVKPPNGATRLVATPDGGVFVAGRDGRHSRIDRDGTLRADGSEPRPSWCARDELLLGEGGLEPAYLRSADPDYSVGRMRMLD